jgi:hypothetical protein
VSTIPASLRALLSDLIDYAGLFPPAALPMQQAVENYASYLAGPDAWALARFVLPVSRFAEFEAAIRSVPTIEPWGISALLGANSEADLAEIDRFNDRNQGRAIVDAVEVKASTSDEVSHIRAFVRGSIIAYFEIPPEKASELLPTINAIHSRAKIRTGGVTPDAIPSSETVARFIMECAKHEVPFKATAGLHHPVRCVKALTYETNAPTGTMHGFLNLFMAACAIVKGRHLPLEDEHKVRFLAMLLDCRNPKLRFTDDIANIDAEGEHKQLPKSYIGDPRYPGGRAATGLSVARIREARREFAISFGSCSFEEPLAELRELNLL